MKEKYTYIFLFWKQNSFRILVSKFLIFHLLYISKQTHFVPLNYFDKYYVIMQWIIAQNDIELKLILDGVEFGNAN